MGWSHFLYIDTIAATSAGPKVQAPGKVLVQMPTDDWLCKNLSKLNLTFSSLPGALDI